MDSNDQPLVHVKQARLARGISQADLAEIVGVSRQSLIAVEAGRQSPSTWVALALARALDCAVEDLFELPAPASLRVALPPVGAVSVGGRVAIGHVGDRWVAHPVADTDYAAADGLMVGADVARPVGTARTLRGNVLVSGCAPVLTTLADHAARSGGAVRWVPGGSGRSLQLMAAGQVHVAGLHFRGQGNRTALEASFPGQRLLMMTLVSWRQGLVFARGNPLGLAAGHLCRPGLRVAWREPGAGARTLLVEALGLETGVRPAAGDRDGGAEAETGPHSRSRVAAGGSETGGFASERYGVGPPAARHDPGACGRLGSEPSQSWPGGPVCGGHLDVARAVAAGAADVGVTIEAAAAAFGLEFLPLSQERFDLCLPAALAEQESVHRLLDAVDSRGFRAEAAAFGGYGVDATGHAVEVGP